MFKKTAHYLIILLIEGAALMAVELMGAKLVAPFFGSSLYVWTAVLGFTVSGLTLGYYVGGRIASSARTGKLLFYILGIAALLVFAMPYTATALVSVTGRLDLISGICITSFLLLLPPMFCFGTVGPIVVNLMDARLHSHGKVAGTAYFVSTLGGIFGTFLFGVCLIPLAGLRLSACITGVSLAAATLVCFYMIRKSAFVTRPGLVSPDNASAHSKITSAQNAKTGAALTSKTTWTIYLYAVLEGGIVMAAELMAARMLAPWFGSSLYVWTIVMACTLLGLALGYFAGGRLPEKYPPLNSLRWALLAASVFLLLMHFTARQMTFAFEPLSIKVSAIFVSCALIIPPLVFLGMVPALLIRHISSVTDEAGAVTGRIFTLSSASGIVSLFVTGFFIIPQYGLTTPSILAGFITGIFPFLQLIRQKKYVSLAFIIVALCSWSLKKTISVTPNVEIRYFSEGLLGQVVVADVNKYDTNKLNDRLLLVNKIGEAQIDRKSGATKWEYPYYITSLASKFPEGSKALMLGLGGGQIPNMLNLLKFNVDVVELDQRIVDVAQDYFYLNKNINVTVDDARHYLETTEKNYDMIIIDVFHGDIAPPHMLSLESFKKARSLLNKNGVIIVNFFGYLSGKKGMPGRSVYNTMAAAGLRTKILPTNGAENERNSLFVGSNEDQTFSVIRSPLLLFNKIVNIDSLFLDVSKLDLKNSEIFTDDKPSLDLINTDGVIDFRKVYTDLTKGLLKEGVPLFD